MKNNNTAELLAALFVGLAIGFTAGAIAMRPTPADFKCPKETWCFQRSDGNIVRYSKTSSGFPDAPISSKHNKVCAIRKGVECLRFHLIGIDRKRLLNGRWVLLGYDESDWRLKRRGPDCRNASQAQEAASKDPMGDVKYSCTRTEVEHRKSCYGDANCVEAW
ncbi:hypothetical protein LCGC14_2460350 [marine sediment metagenome]|uniref:Uncharacterized protein n=1 Tax=marine sediment metagenome TaxID=412755 RepID=A0A0F9BDE7_9ZZZZ